MYGILFTVYIMYNGFRKSWTFHSLLEGNHFGKKWMGGELSAERKKSPFHREFKGVVGRNESSFLPSGFTKFQHHKTTSTEDTAIRCCCFESSGCQNIAVIETSSKIHFHAEKIVSVVGEKSLSNVTMLLHSCYKLLIITNLLEVLSCVH